MTYRAAGRHAGEALENLLGGLFLDNRIREGIHVLVDRHPHLLEWQWQLRHQRRVHAETDPLHEALQGTNPDELTPREALELLYRLKKL